MLLLTHILCLLIFFDRSTSLSTTRYRGGTLKGDEIQKTAQNIFSICSLLQNPELYSVEWATGAAVCGNDSLVTTRDVSEGEILSLVPIHFLGLTSSINVENRDVIFFDENKDGTFFKSMKKESKYRRIVPATSHFGNQFFVDINPSHKPSPGWVGHLVTTNEVFANCKIVPLVPPIFALVSTCSTSIGQQLFQGTSEVSEIFLEEVKARYVGEILEMETYINMAFPKRTDDFPKRHSIPGMPFHTVNRNYPGMVNLYQDPDIIEIENFLTNEECDSLIAKARINLLPCVTKDPISGEVTIDPDRTSTNANIPQREIPGIVSKILHLANCDASQLEIFQILRYEKDQHFMAHTDGFCGPTTACGYQDSNRIVTIFCYLNDVLEGGETRFTNIGLSIKPSKGKAVIHFPATTGLIEDPRTEHEGSPAIDEKWLLVTWVWMTSRVDELYAESKLPHLSADII